LQSTTEQWGMHFAQTSAAVHLSWLTAHLYEEQCLLTMTHITSSSRWNHEGIQNSHIHFSAYQPANNALGIPRDKPARASCASSSVEVEEEDMSSACDK